jgi:hypothetical protein
MAAAASLPVAFTPPPTPASYLKHNPWAIACFGIAFVMTMLERRTLYHQSVLVGHLPSSDEAVQQFVNRTSRFLLTRGASGPDAIHQSYGPG